MLKIVLLSTYDLGHQPFGLASPAAWLRAQGAQVSCLDLAVDPFSEKLVAAADLVAFYLPMHTATRLAVPYIQQVQEINPAVHLCFYGLYAVLNETYLRTLGGDTILSGEFESGLRSLAARLEREAESQIISNQLEPKVSLTPQHFLVPDRRDLRPLDQYAHLHHSDGKPRQVGYTQASRGCKHHCRHCPIVPVYQGRFRIVQHDVVLEDIRRQVAAGAEHITFGDPDFFNGPGHALPLVRALHAEFPGLTYDATIKIEHLLKHAAHLETLQETGCLFITSAVESVDDHTLAILDKGHTRADFLEAVAACREAGLVLQPTFVAFHPWITIAGYQDLLQVIAELGLVEQVAPIQLAIRLLLPQGSLLLDLPDVQSLIRAFDETSLVYPWQHLDPAVDQLQENIQLAVQRATGRGLSRQQIFNQIWTLAGEAAGETPQPVPLSSWAPQQPIPFLSEPWYC